MASKNYGPNKQLERIGNAGEAIAAALGVGYKSAAILDAAFTGAINGENTTSLFRRWWKLAVDQITQNSGTVNRYDLLCRWFKMLSDAWGDKIYTIRIADWQISNGATAYTPMGILAEKTKAPLCTEADAESFHWMDEDPMYWYMRFNGLSLEDGTMNILAVEGIDDDFDITGNTAPVYTGSMGLWIAELTDGSYEYTSWSAAQRSGFRPYASDVAPGGKHRPMHWEATFTGSLTSGGKLTSGSGYAGMGWGRNTNVTAISRSMTTGLSDARKMGAYEGLYSDTEWKHLIDQWRFRHWTTENSGELEGCTNYNLDYVVSKAEEGVTSVVLTTAQAANLVIGSFVDVGSTSRGGQIARGNIIRIAEETIDGTTYARVELDVTATFTTTAETHVATLPWTPGSTEHLPGHKDGSLYSLTNGKTPARIGGIEILDGAWTVGGDPIWNSDWNADRTPKSIYSVYECRDATKQAGSITASHNLAGTFTGPNSGWQYMKHFQLRTDDMLMPEGFSGSGSTYLKSAFDFNGSSGARALWVFGALNSGAYAGLAGAAGSHSPGGAYWNGRPRLSGSGKTRGEWAA